MNAETLFEALRAPIGQRALPEAANGGLRRRAAVLCPIIERAEELHVILTQRSAHLKAHAGQISFPGGKIDADDPSPLHAALREAEEEIGLTAGKVDIIGQLHPYDTSTGFLVFPFVGLVDSRFRPVAEPGEVDEVFEVPLAFLMDHGNHRPLRVIRHGQPRIYYEMPYKGRRIWGATAGMLRDLADRIAASREQYAGIHEKP